MDDVDSRPFSLRAVGRSASVLIAGAGVAQVLGIVRELYLAARVGVSVELDALLIALALPTIMAGILTSGGMTALVPAYVEIRARRGSLAAAQFAGGVLVWTGIAGLLLSAVLALFAEALLVITGPGLAPTARASAAAFLQLLAPLAFVGALAAILQAVCQAEERFRGIALANLATTAITVLAMVLLWDQLGLLSVVVGTLLGMIVASTVLYVSTVLAGARPRLMTRIPRAETMAFLRHAWPLTLSAGILQLNTIADRAIASLLAPGAVSAIRFAEVLVRAPIGTIAPAWGNAIYPALVRLTRAPGGGHMGGAATSAIRYATVVFVPVAALTAAVAPTAVAVAYLRGAFGPDDVRLTAPIVAAFAPLIVILMVSPVLTAALNARQRGRVLLAGGILNVVLNFVLDIVLGLSVGVAGIALSSSIASAIVLIYFARRLSIGEPSFEPRRVGSTILRAGAAAAVPAVGVAVASWGGWLPGTVVPGLLALAILGGAGVAIYALLAGGVLRVPEVRTLAAQALSVLRRTGRRSINDR